MTSGADVNVQDEDGDTPLHVALIKRASLRERESTATPTGEAGLSDSVWPRMAAISSQLQQLQVDVLKDRGLTIACFLAKEGADLSLKNHANKTPLDLAASADTLQLLNWFATRGTVPMGASTAAATAKKPLGPASSQQGGHAGEYQFLDLYPLPFIKHIFSCSLLSICLFAFAGVSEQLMEVDSETVPCEICMDTEAVVRLEPCGHVLTCEECSVRMKKCLRCQQIVTAKVHKTTRNPIAEKPGSKQRERPGSLERLRQLESKIQEMEESSCCSICMERRKNVAFLCGHSACSRCAQPLRSCHMCRKPITRRIQLYL